MIILGSTDLGSTDARAPKGFAPIAIGLGLTLIHFDFAVAPKPRPHKAPLSTPPFSGESKTPPHVHVGQSPLPRSANRCSGYRFPRRWLPSKSPRNPRDRSCTRYRGGPSPLRSTHCRIYCHLPPRTHTRDAHIVPFCYQPLFWPPLFPERAICHRISSHLQRFTLLPSTVVINFSCAHPDCG
jgi:hypothetical protein